WLLRQATRVADRLAAAGQRGRKVHVKLRDTSFTTWTRQCTLERPTAQTMEIFAAARTLVAKLEAEGLLPGRRFRLTGLGVSELIEGREPRQLELLGASEAEGVEARGEAVQDVLSEVRRRFGGKALFPAGVGEPGDPD